MRELAEKAEQFGKHTDVLGKFEQNQQQLDAVEKQINKNLNFEKHLENLNRGLLYSETKRADSILDTIHSRHDITSFEMERINLINEQMRLRANPILHRFTARQIRVSNCKI